MRRPVMTWMMSGMQVERWRSMSEWPLTIAAVVFLFTYSWQVLAQPGESGIAVSDAIIWLTWAMFAIDYVVSLSLAEDRKTWFLKHLLDLAIVLLPILRPLRLLRLVVILQALQRTIGTAVRGKIVVYVVGASALLMYVAALALLESERGQGGNVENFGDAIWWSFVTVTTVGYGDFYPVTLMGRIIAAALMLSGIALIGVVTGSLASWLVEKVGDEVDKRDTIERRAIRQDIALLSDEVVALREALSASGTTRADGADRGPAAPPREC